MEKLREVERLLAEAEAIMASAQEEFETMPEFELALYREAFSAVSEAQAKVEYLVHF